MRPLVAMLISHFKAVIFLTKKSQITHVIIQTIQSSNSFTDPRKIWSNMIHQSQWTQYRSIFTQEIVTVRITDQSATKNVFFSNQLYLHLLALLDSNLGMEIENIWKQLYVIDIKFFLQIIIFLSDVYWKICALAAPRRMTIIMSSSTDAILNKRNRCWSLMQVVPSSLVSDLCQYLSHRGQNGRTIESNVNVNFTRLHSRWAQLT